MIWILYLLIVLWGIFGILALLLPKKAKDLVKKITFLAPYWVWAVVAFILAFLVWQSANFSNSPLFVQVFAVLAGIKGLSLLILPKNKTDGMLNRIVGTSDVFFRIWGIVALFFAYYLYQILI